MLKKLALFYWVLVVVIYLAAGEQFHYTAVTSDAFSGSIVVGELVEGVTVRQRVTVPADRLESVSLLLGTYERENTGTLLIRLEDDSGTVVARGSLDVSQVTDGKYTVISLDAQPEGYKNRSLTLAVTAQGCTQGNAVTLFAGNTVTTGRFDVAKEISEQDLYRVDDTAGTGVLCVKLNCVEALSFYKTYWVITVGIFAALAVLAAVWMKQAGQGKNNPLVAVYSVLTRYNFLIRQLVARDFKTKYKRSLLGMAWSFLNPLLTMSVQYVVFSTIFKSDIENFPVYLLCGIVFFSFFTEAVSMGMTSITNNAVLIKKVYMPKYIYPVSCILSSLVNFALSIVPLFLVMLLTGTPFRPSLLLLVFDVLCLLGFVLGMGLLLTTAMTFFQDVQFLWNIASMLWMYLTPIFYPESIIPQNLILIYRLNPMYQYITFARTCILDGISPEPIRYLWCILSSGVVLLLGIWVFKRHQDQFILYL